MSGGKACTCPAGIKVRRPWVVLHRRCNHSAFNGYRYTPSVYSAVSCVTCGAVWRTKAAYVSALPDAGTYARAISGIDQRATAKLVEGLRKS